MHHNANFSFKISQATTAMSKWHLAFGRGEPNLLALDTNSQWQQTLKSEEILFQDCSKKNSNSSIWMLLYNSRIMFFCGLCYQQKYQYFVIVYVIQGMALNWQVCEKWLNCLSYFISQHGTKSTQTTFLIIFRTCSCFSDLSIFSSSGSSDSTNSNRRL